MRGKVERIKRKGEGVKEIGEREGGKRERKKTEEKEKK